MDPGSPSLSEPPPPITAESHSASQLNQHPLWQQAAGRGRGNMGPPAARGAGRGRGRGRGAPAPADEDSSVRYERISLLQVELQQAATGGDGADSAIFSEDEDEERRPSRSYRAQDDEDDEEHDYAEEDDDEADRLSALQPSDDEDCRPRKKNKQTGSSSRQGMSAADMMAAAAFGGRQHQNTGDTSDEESQVSRTSSKRKRDAYKEAFPVRGISCVGCSLTNRIGPVKKFVNAHVGEMREDALWRNAARVWKKEVMEPAQREGVEVVEWTWRAIANHFKLHTTNVVIGRTSMIQSLMAMRMQVEGNLIRNENGERTVDKANADLALKIAAAESKERLLLQQSLVPGGGRGVGKGGGQRPAGEE